ncbi:MAG: ABC transporter ATP-binding protein [Treponema sp.]|nr:ABC transporter ATP-binding protein [Treponema sp.]MBQ2600960.1 ABC transporter ATP-binding protein [Treponema sp.]
MIQIDGVRKSFETPRGRKVVLQDFSLTVRDGTFLGVSGESGIGKSTLISMIAGLQKPDSGKITVNGTELTALPDSKLCRFRNRTMGFISQEQSFLENLSVLDNVKLPTLLSRERLLNASEADERAKSLLSELGILELSEMDPSSLSGGENRRVLIARALMNDPEILIADEPTDAVSRTQAEEITAIFRKLSAGGKTVILVTHDESVLGKCDEVIHLGEPLKTSGF